MILKKELGQHFLINDHIAKTIVKTIETFQCKNVLEIGPGGGALTKYILKNPEIQPCFVEIDPDKVAYLKNVFPSINQKIICVDILKLDYPFHEPAVIIGNFPYNISSQIIFKIIHWQKNIQGVIGMFQKEVAERIVAQPNSKAYGILSVITQYFFDVEIIMIIPPTDFNPPPKVQSAVVLFKPKKLLIEIASFTSFKTLVKAGFGQRRKMLRNPLKPYFTDRVLKDPIFSKRAENLTIADFAQLSFKMISIESKSKPI